MPSNSPTNTLGWVTNNAKRKSPSQSLGTSALRRHGAGSNPNRNATVFEGSDPDAFQEEYVSFPALSDSGSEPLTKSVSGTPSPEPLQNSPSRSPSLHEEDTVKISRAQNLIKSFGDLFSRKVRRGQRPASLANQKNDRILSLMQMPRRYSTNDPQGQDDRRTVSDPPQRPMSRNSVHVTRETASAEPTSPVRLKTMERTMDRLRRHL